VKKIKIVSIVGNRPQFIKLAALNIEIKNYKKFFKHSIIHTGQHFDKSMTDIFFKQLSISKPKYNLDVCKGNHGENTGRMIEKLEIILIKENPTAVIVYGDTDSTLAASISSAKLNIKIIHIEAGLRSYNKNMPEEINRIVTDHISYINFAPTKNAYKNLINEGIDKKNIYNVGDIMLDSVISNIKTKKFKETENKIKKLNNKYFLLTIHDFINFVLSKLGEINTQVIWPIHPRINKLIKLKNFKIPKNIEVIRAISYFETLAYINNCQLVITDSGGLQKEAYFLNKPSVILRDRTEWKEIQDNKSCMILKNKKDLLKLIKKALTIKFKKGKEFGDGKSAKKMLNIIKNKFR